MNGPFEKIMICLDLTETDEKLVRYMDSFVYKYKPEKLYFIHAVPSLKLSPAKKALYDSKGIVPDERLRQIMETTVSKQLPRYKMMEAEFIVAEGKTEKEILHWAGVKAVDLLVMGRKRGNKHAAIVPQRLVRHADTNVLLVPEDSKHELANLMVPTDFSDASSKGTQMAVAMLKESPTEKLTLFYANGLPHYLPEGVSPHRLMRELEGISQEEMDAFAFKNKLAKYEPVIYPMLSKGTAATIAKYAKEHKPDMLIVGEEKHSDSAVFFLGSVTERVIQLTKRVPIMVVRAKPGEKRVYQNPKKYLMAN